MMRIAALLLALCAPVAAAQAGMQPAEAAAEPDPRALAEARAMLRAADFERQLESVALHMAESNVNTMIAEFTRREGVPLPADIQAELRQIATRNVEEMLEEMRPTALEDAARVYARYFTADEIAELNRLQSNPVMVKMQRIAPEFTTELTRLAMETAARRMPTVNREAHSVVQAWLARQQDESAAPST